MVPTIIEVRTVRREAECYLRSRSSEILYCSCTSALVTGVTRAVADSGLAADDNDI